MKLFWPFLLLLPNKYFRVLDKSDVKTYAHNWVNIWKTTPNHLSDLRMNEAWKAIIWSTQQCYNNYSHCLVYKHDNYFILVEENKIQDQLQVVGLLENPDNIYSVDQIESIHRNLLDIAKQQNYTLDYSKMRNWSHGYYFYEYHNK
jgi:hypothetical protein